MGALTGEAPSGLSDLGGQFIAFGHLGVIWWLLNHLSLTVQLNAQSSPYGASDVATLGLAVTEDDGLHRGAPDTGLHAAIRWRPECPEWRPANRPETVQGHDYEITIDRSDVSDHSPAL